MTKKQPSEVTTVEVTLRVPMLVLGPGERRPSVRRVQVQNLSLSESRALRALYDGLQWTGEEIHTSLTRGVKHLACDPVRWLLQQLAAEAGV